MLGSVTFSVVKISPDPSLLTRGTILVPDMVILTLRKMGFYNPPFEKEYNSRDINLNNPSSFPGGGGGEEGAFNRPQATRRAMGREQG
jgi:hypothetical protein